MMKKVAIVYCVGAALTFAWQLTATNLVGACDFNQEMCKSAAVQQCQNALIWPIYLARLGG